MSICEKHNDMLNDIQVNLFFFEFGNNAEMSSISTSGQHCNVLRAQGKMFIE